MRVFWPWVIFVKCSPVLALACALRCPRYPLGHRLQSRSSEQSRLLAGLFESVLELSSSLRTGRQSRSIPWPQARSFEALSDSAKDPARAAQYLRPGSASTRCSVSLCALGDTDAAQPMGNKTRVQRRIFWIPVTVAAVQRDGPRPHFVPQLKRTRFPFVAATKRPRRLVQSKFEEG